MKTILVLGAGGSPAVNFAKSVRKEYTLIGVDISVNHAYLTKEFYDKFVVINPKEKLKEIQCLIDRYNVDGIHAQPDIEVEWLSENRNTLRNVKIFLPSKEVIGICQDKLKSENVWASNGIIDFFPMKVDLLPNMRKQYLIISSNLGCPFWIRATKGAGARGGMKIEKYEQFEHWIKFWKATNPEWEFIAQKYYRGRDMAYQSLWHEGNLVSGQGRERLEYIYPQLSPSGLTGTPIVAKACNDKELEIAAIEAIKAIDNKPHGIYCVDLKENNFRFFPTEINVGRFFTTSNFFAQCGKNMPLAYLNLMFDLSVSFLKAVVPADTYYFRHIDCGGKIFNIGNEWGKEFNENFI